jgi:hypothetical protein
MHTDIPTDQYIKHLPRPAAAAVKVQVKGWDDEQWMGDTTIRSQCNSLRQEEGRRRRRRGKHGRKQMLSLLSSYLTSSHGDA